MIQHAERAAAPSLFGWRAFSAAVKEVQAMSEKKNDITADTSNTPRPVEVFYSYAHADEDFRAELVKHLRLLERQGVITGWHDRNISAGTDWKNAIDDHLESAGIILLLISADFLASDYCYDFELKRAMERHAEGKARVIPIILRKCDWSSAPFGKLQALPKNARPVRNWDDPDEAYTDVVGGIRRAVKEIVP